MAINIALTSTTATTMAKIVTDLQTLIGAINTELAGLDSRLAELDVRLDALEGRADLTERLSALELTVANLPPTAAVPTPSALTTEPLARPANLDPAKIEMVYDNVVFYYRDMEVRAQRIGDRRWRLVAQLNFIVISPVVWTYDEIVEGTPTDVYRHAIKRLEELSRLKPIHDAVHDRVRAMSEGAP